MQIARPAWRAVWENGSDAGRLFLKRSLFDGKNEAGEDDSEGVASIFRKTFGRF
jgi:hypothetical protein